MDYTINTYPKGFRPQVSLPDKALYTLLTEEGMRKMVSNHYDLLSKSSIARLFPPEGEHLEEAKKHSADFFIQICGGPDYFNQNRGEPILVRRHQSFRITAEGRVVWLECYKQVLSELDIDDAVKQSFWDYLNKFSHWMVNA